MPGGATAGLNVGSSLQYERGILLLEDFEGTENWDEEGTGADFEVSHETVAAFFGTNGLRIMTRTTDPADGDYVLGEKWFPPGQSDLVVVRFRWSCPDVSKLEDFRVTVHMADGTNEYQAGLKFTPNETKLYYLNSGGTYTEISGYTQGGKDRMWEIVEFQFDMGLHEYLKVLFHGIETDLSDNSIYSAGADTDVWCKIGLRAEASGAAAAQARIDALYIGEFV